MPSNFEKALKKLSENQAEIDFSTYGQAYGNTSYGESRFDAPNMSDKGIQEGLYIDQRYEQQSIPEVIGKSIGNTIWNIPVGLAEQAGYLLDLESHIKTIQGTGGDYDNALTRLSRNKNIFGDVYEKKPGETNLSDPIWWINGGSQLIESVATFAATGFGVGTVLGSGAKALALALKSTKAAKGLKLGAQILTNAELAYAEGAMSGNRVFKDTYKTLINKGYSEQEALQLAGESAARTVQINTAVNTVLNIPQTAAIFREVNYAKALNREFKRMPNEKLGDYIARLKKTDEGKTFLQKIGKEHLVDIPLEATEEIVNQYAEDMGIQYLNNILVPNNKKDWIDVLTETLEKDETWAAAMWGAVGGPLQSSLMSTIPKVKQTKLKEEERKKEQVKNLVDYLEAFQDAQNRLVKYSQENNEVEYKKAQNDLFGLESYNNIVRGTSEQLVNEYKEIGKLTEEEASLRGFNTDPESDNYYKKLSKDKVSDINNLTNKFEEFQSKYGYDEELISNGFANLLFAHYISIYNTARNIDSYNRHLNKVTAEFNQNKIRRGTDFTLGEGMNIQAKINALENQIKENQRKIDELSKQQREGNALTRTQEYLYGDFEKAYEAIEKRSEETYELINKYRDQINQMFESYKLANPDKSFEDFNNAINENQYEIDYLSEAEQKLARARQELRTAENTLNSKDSEEGIKEFKKEVSEERKKEKENN